MISIWRRARRIAPAKCDDCGKQIRTKFFYFNRENGNFIHLTCLKYRLNKHIPAMNDSYSLEEIRGEVKHNGRNPQR